MFLEILKKGLIVDIFRAISAGLREYFDKLSVILQPSDGLMNGFQLYNKKNTLCPQYIRCFRVTNTMNLTNYIYLKITALVSLITLESPHFSSACMHLIFQHPQQINR